MRQNARGSGGLIYKDSVAVGYAAGPVRLGSLTAELRRVLVDDDVIRFRGHERVDAEIAHYALIILLAQRAVARHRFGRIRFHYEMQAFGCFITRVKAGIRSLHGPGHGGFGQRGLIKRHAPTKAAGEKQKSAQACRGRAEAAPAAWKESGLCARRSVFCHLPPLRFLVFRPLVFFTFLS